MDNNNNKDKEEEKCSCCGVEFVYGVSYQCFVCSNRVCIKHFEESGGYTFCYGCAAEDFVLTRCRTDLLDH